MAEPAAARRSPTIRNRTCVAHPARSPERADRQGVYEPQELAGSKVLAKLAKRVAPSVDDVGEVAFQAAAGLAGALAFADFRSR
jgi:hypothetical protein